MPSPLAHAAHLPPEILDHIFEFCYADNSPGLFDYKPNLAKVCRSWRGAVQRHAFKIVFINASLVEPLTRLISETMGIGELIRIVDLNLWTPDDIGDQKTVEENDPFRQVNHLLALLPHLTTLRLFLHRPDDFSGLALLPNLRELQLTTVEYGPALPKSYRQIIAATPNIRTLSLSNQHWSTGGPPTNVEAFDPVDLPSLTNLSLRSAQFCRFLDKLNILSVSSLNQINRLELEPFGDCSRTYSSLALLEKMGGSNIKTLVMGPISHQEQSDKDDEIVQACTGLENLIAKRRIALSRFPPTLSTIIYRTRNFRHERLKWIMRSPVGEEPGLSQRKEDWAHVKRFEIDIERESTLRGYPSQRWWRAEWEELKRDFLEKDVELALTVNGVMLYRSS